jgi:hypothetical protein
MSHYDVAAGARNTGLDSLIGKFYALPAARNGLFKGSVTQNVDVIGTVKVTYDVKTAPKFALTPPTTANWQASQRRDSTQETPPPNTIQVMLSDLAGTATVGDAAPLPAEGPVTVYGTVGSQGGKVNIQITAVLIDEGSFSDWDKLIVNAVLIPELFKLADSMIPAIVLPTVPSFAGLNFQPLSLLVTPQGILLGTTLAGGGNTDLSGFTWPPQDLFAMATLNPVNKLLASQVNGTHSKEDSTGPSGWSASGKVTATNLTMVAVIGGDTVTLNTDGSFSCYGQLSGVGVGVTKALLCPIAAAADAISDPSKWDKVVSSFNIQYKPKPMPVPVSFTTDAPSGTPPSQGITAKVPSGKLPSSILVTVSPSWSGSVTGTVLATAAAAFIDLISVMFGKLIIEDLVGKYASFSLPVSEMSQKISFPGGSVTISLAAAVGAALVPFRNQLTQPLVITIV